MPLGRTRGSKNKRRRSLSDENRSESTDSMSIDDSTTPPGDIQPPTFDPLFGGEVNQ